MFSTEYEALQYSQELVNRQKDLIYKINLTKAAQLMWDTTISQPDAPAGYEIHLQQVIQLDYAIKDFRNDVKAFNAHVANWGYQFSDEVSLLWNDETNPSALTSEVVERVNALAIMKQILTKGIHDLWAEKRAIWDCPAHLADELGRQYTQHIMELAKNIKAFKQEVLVVNQQAANVLKAPFDDTLPPLEDPNARANLSSTSTNLMTPQRESEQKTQNGKRKADGYEEDFRCVGFQKRKFS